LSEVDICWRKKSVSGGLLLCVFVVDVICPLVVVAAAAVVVIVVAATNLFQLLAFVQFEGYGSTS